MCIYIYTIHYMQYVIIYYRHLWTKMKIYSEIIEEGKADFKPEDEDSGSNHRPTFGIDQELTNRHAWGGMDHLYPCILECMEEADTI